MTNSLFFNNWNLEFIQYWPTHLILSSLSVISFSFFLTQKITLSNSSQSQRSIFFDVGFKNPISDFDLTLSQLNKGKRKPQCEPVWSCEILKGQWALLLIWKKESFFYLLIKGGVGDFGETSSSALEFENTQPEKICHFLTEPLLQHTRTRTWPMRARDKFVHRWKADRQVGHPVILAGPALKIFIAIGMLRAFHGI